MDSVDRSRDPIREVDRRIKGIRASHGAWLVAPLADECTLIEYYTWSDPGGALGWAQGLVAKRAFRATLRGIMRMARDHVLEPHDGDGFVRADGSRGD